MWVFPAILALIVLVPISLLVLRVPTRTSKLLARWGVPNPGETDRALVSSYLSRRRWLYLAAAVLSGTVFTLTGSKLDGVGPFLIWVFLPLSLAMLVTELLLVLRKPDSTTRRASLTPRSRRDYVPRWATWVLASLLVPGLAGAAFMSPMQESVSLHLDFWIATGVLLGLGLIAETTIRIAVARRPFAEANADTVMRIRSARAMAGFEIGISGFVFLVPTAGWGFAMGYFEAREIAAWTLILVALAGFIGAMLCWVSLAAPPRPPRPVATPAKEVA